jgi:hypothetical protein
MTNKNFFIALFAVGSLFSLIACKKKETALGKEIYDESMLLDANGVDTFSIVAYSELIDSTVTANARLGLLGSYNDPVFGKVSAGFYTQVRLAANNPNFGDVADIIIDSVVLAMEFRDQYGPGNYQQDFAVYRVVEGLSRDSLYRNNSSTATGESLIAEGFSSFTPNNKVPFVNGNDTLPPQLRLRLKNSLGEELINSAGAGNMLNNDVFLDYFKGLYVCTENANVPANSGAVYGLDLLDADSKLVIYYKQGDTFRTFDLIINSNSARYNRVLYNYSGTRLEQLLLDPSQGAKEFYAQSGNVRAVVKFPSVQNLSNKTVVHRATLYLPYQYFNGDDKYPSPFIAVFNKRATGDAIWGLGVNNGVLVPINHPVVPLFKRYTVDVTSFIQGLVKQSPIFTIPELMIVGSRTNDNVERIIFNGIESDNKYQPKLIITYTEF